MTVIRMIHRIITDIDDEKPDDAGEEVSRDEHTVTYERKSND